MNSKTHARITAPSPEIQDKNKGQMKRARSMKNTETRKLNKSNPAANKKFPQKKKKPQKPMVESYLPKKQKPMVDSYLPRNDSHNSPMEIHVEIESDEPKEAVEPKEAEEPLCFFNKGPNGELLDGNADVYRALGFGWVDANDPTRAEWAEFCKTGFDCTGMSDCMDIVEKYYPNWRTEKRPPRSRSRSRTRTPQSDRRSSTPEDPGKDQPSSSSL